MSTIDIVVLVLGVVLTLLNIWERISLAKEKASTPHRENEQRITRLEAEVDDIKELLKSDKTDIEKLERGNKIMLHSLRALLEHGIDGNNTDKMIAAAEELDNYLIDK